MNNHLDHHWAGQNILMRRTRPVNEITRHDSHHHPPDGDVRRVHRARTVEGPHLRGVQSFHHQSSGRKTHSRHSIPSDDYGNPHHDVFAELDCSRHEVYQKNIPIKVSSKRRALGEHDTQSTTAQRKLPLAPEEARRLALIYLTGPKRTFTEHQLRSIEAITDYDYRHRRKREVLSKSRSRQEHASATHRTRFRRNIPAYY